jgi:hypothetical protein
MKDPIKVLRKTLFSIHPISYRIASKGLDKQSMDRKIFIQVIDSLKEIEDRRDFLQAEIGIDVTAYEDKFMLVIENLFKLCFNKEQLDLIHMYLYQLHPDKEWDGTISIEVNKKEKVVAFKSSNDVWKVIRNFNSL